MSNNPEEHAKAIVANMEQVRSALETAMARINEGNDRQGLIWVLAAVGGLHDATLAITKVLADVVAELAEG